MATRLLSELAGQDIIDSRDIIEALKTFEGMERAEIIEEYDEAEADLVAEARAFEEDPPCVDWSHGEGMIRESYFTRYAEQLADDLGCINGDAKWPMNHIDWEAAARDLKHDYTTIDFGGDTYYVRS